MALGVTRCRSVLRLDSMYEMAEDKGEDVVFTSEFAPGEQVHVYDMALNRTVWEEMGSPKLITVQVEAGDRLNTEE